MDPLQLIVAQRATRPGSALAHSALPDAPVVPDEISIRRRSRTWTAALLRRAADAIAPTDWRASGRPTLSTGGSAA